MRTDDNNKEFKNFWDWFWDSYWHIALLLLGIILGLIIAYLWYLASTKEVESET